MRHICAGPLKPLTGVGTSPGSSWDPLSSVHGKPVDESTVDADEVATDVAPQSSHSSRSVGSGAQSARRMSPRDGETREGSIEMRADLLQFQAYVRQRLSDMERRMPAKPSLRDEAELAFLEKEVIEDHMSPKRRALRDPLCNVKIEDITHTNLPLICGFLSEGGSILPSKLTGVSHFKQKALAKAIKRARKVRPHS